MKGKGSSPTAGRHGEEKRGTGGKDGAHRTGAATDETRNRTGVNPISSHNPIPSTRPPIFSSSRLSGSGVLLQYLLIKSETLIKFPHQAPFLAILPYAEMQPRMFSGGDFADVVMVSARVHGIAVFWVFCPFPSRPAINAAADGISFS